MKTILSKLTFENLNVGNVPSTFDDNNKYSNFKWVQRSTPKISSSDNLKVLKIDSVGASIYASMPTIKNIDEFKNIDWQVEVSIKVLNISSQDQGYFGFTNGGSRHFSFMINTNEVKIDSNGKSIVCKYSFKSNTEYNIVISHIDTYYTFMINGLEIGYIEDFEFNSQLAANNSFTMYLGSIDSSSGSYNLSNAEIWNVNISVGKGVKYLNSFTKYGANLISRLNFKNVDLGLESVYNTKQIWVYDKDKVTNTLVETSFNTIVDNIFTLDMVISNKTNIENINLIDCGDYKVVYNYLKIGMVNEPKVVVNELTTSALDFEDGIVDKVGTTVWGKSGTADVTSTNKIFGNSSFETKALGDSLYTTNAVITGGDTPFTIEFYFLTNNFYTSISGAPGDITIQYPLISQSNSAAFGEQAVYIHKDIKNIQYYRQQSFSNQIGRIGGKNKIRLNEINKLTISFDGSAIRYFLNDELDFVIGSIYGWMNVAGQPIRFMDCLVPAWPGYRIYTSGLIDNINIHDGIATKVRDPDPYEEFLVVDLAFDGENNSTKIVDNGSLKSNWLVNGNAKISTTQKFDGFSSLNTINPSSHDSYAYANLEPIIVDDLDFTISVDFMLTTYNSDYSSAIVSSKLSNGANGFCIAVASSESNRVLTTALGSENEYVVDLDKRLTGPRIEINKKYNIVVICKNNILSLYINNILYSTAEQLIKTGVNLSLGGGIQIGKGGIVSNGSNINVWNSSCNGYIKNFKIYKGVAVIPENPTGKIQLDFDNNLVDKYGNSTWTNNGVTFDQVNSVKGHAAKFNGSNSILSISNNQNLNFENKNFVLSYDFKNVIFDSVNNRYLLGNGMPLAHGAFWRLFGTSSSKYGSFNLNYDNTNYGLTNTVEVENNYYNEKILRNSDTLVGFKNDVAISALNVINTFNVDFKNMSIGTASSLTSSISYFNGYFDNFKSYKEDLININSTLYVTNSNVNVAIDNDSLYTSYNGTPPSDIYATLVLNDSPILSNFIAEVELFIKSDSNNHGILNFRTSNYSSNNMDNFGYSAYISGNLIRFGKGSPWSLIASKTIPTELQNNDYHILKVIADGNNFKLFIDDILIIDVNDSTYSIPSNFAWCTYLVSSWTGVSSRIKNLDIYDLENNLLYHKDFKSKIETQIDRPAVHLPLETNATNIGFTPLTINSVGNPTYHVVDGKKCIKFESGKYLTINSNNIFNLGASSDFYIEMDVYLISLNSYNNILRNIGSWTTTSSAIQILSNGIVNLYALDYKIGSSSNTVNISEFNKLIVYRKGNVTSINLNGIITTFNDLAFDFSNGGSQIGSINTTSNDYINGYMSNFKMFVGTSEIPETYNDKKVLDLDFNPTGKSYLFKDNNNKCVIHPVNITQRDYQDSQYCCTFNGTDQYLQLGKNDLLNFGFDDFVISIVFKSDLSKVFNMLLSCHHDGSSANRRPYIGVCGNNHPTIENRNKFVFDMSGTTETELISKSDFLPNTIYKVDVVCKNKKVMLYVDGIIDTEITTDITEAVNFNTLNNTFIGLNSTTNIDEGAYYKGTIYSIKILRNTTDLSLLENPDDHYEFNESFTLTNGVESVDIVTEESNEHNIKFVSDTDKVTLKVNDQTVEVPKTTDINSLTLFDQYNSNVNDIKLYNAAIYENDEYIGSEPIDTEFCEIDEEDDMEEIVAYNIGDHNIIGFIEGYENRKFKIFTDIENYIVHFSQSDIDYSINDVDINYIDSYMIHDLENDQIYPINKNEMIKGFISGTINLKQCGVKAIDMKVYCYKADDSYRQIGIYDVDENGYYNIPNLDVNSRYDIIFRDASRKIKDQISNYRKPMQY